jgi:hypothetical protein
MPTMHRAIAAVEIQPSPVYVGTTKCEAREHLIQAAMATYQKTYFGKSNATARAFPLPSNRR